MPEIPQDQPVPPVVSPPPARPETPPAPGVREKGTPSGLAEVDRGVPQPPPRDGKLPVGDAVKLAEPATNRQKLLGDYLIALKPYLEKRRLSVEEKDQVLEILKQAQGNGLLPAAIDKLQRNGSLKPLYDKLAAPSRAITFLTILTGGALLLPGVAAGAAVERRPDFIRLLKEGGIDPSLIASLEKSR